MSREQSLFTIVISLLIFACACALPAISVILPMYSGDTAPLPLPGWLLLRLGFMSICVTLAWFANICYALSLLCTLFLSRRFAFIFAVVALVLTVDTLRWYCWPFALNSMAAQTQVSLVSVLPGFWVWIVSMLVIVLSACWTDVETDRPRY